MKSQILSFLLALSAIGPSWAQTHAPGPVVYPTNSPTAVATDTNAVPVSPTVVAPITPPSEPPPADPATLSPASAPTPAPNNLVTPPDPGQMMSPPSGGGGASDDIDDISPPVFYLKPVIWPWVLLALLVVGSIATLLWVVFRALAEARAKTAYELTLEKLEQAQTLLNEQNPEPYAVFVSETIRSYLGERFNMPSTRRTTEEFLSQMRQDRTTPLAQHRDLLQSFLEACDLVKFAHYQPARTELEQVQQRAVNFVTATKPLEASPA